MSTFSSKSNTLSLQAYRYTAEFTDTAWAWEFLRRNPHYHAHFVQHGTASDWLLLRFEGPNMNARHADIFWQPSACNRVLPLIAGAESAINSPALYGFGGGFLLPPFSF